MKVVQYPHYLFAVNSDNESIRDANGNWSDSEAINVFVSACREETDGRGSEIQIAGGTFHKYTSIIQLPKGREKVDVGTTVIVTNDIDGTDIRIEGIVLKYDVGQLHNRLWV
jgi:hypothetical protein